VSSSGCLSRYHPIYAAAVEHNLPVAIHPGSEGVGLAYPLTPAGYPSTYFEFHTGLVANYIGHLISLVAEGVFVKFPPKTPSVPALSTGYGVKV
jgi:predicted TIM-barrel fold metal-dependent hydrolase